MSTGIVNVFARAPIRGRVKSRLAVDVGEVTAVRAYRNMLRHALHTAASLPGVTMQVWTAGGRWHPAFAHQASRAQPPGDLGAKMSFAMRWSLARSPAAVIIGSDCPSLAPHHLQSALDLLCDHDVVLGPATDGGYYLIGARRHCPALFRHMNWGSEQVLDRTIRQLRRSNLSWQLLEPLRDVDRAADLRAAQRSGTLALDPRLG